ncbi:MAG: threonylcarbamoyl-AMP synthase [Burkholderiales bacterium]|nr:threonylcarbamoyl-AMP synthase [Burkholderiales bacterium]
MSIVPVNAETLARAVALLRRGELVAFPTETVYGLGADAGNPRGVRAIFAAKGRPADHPVIVHVADLAHARQWALALPPAAEALAAAFWPGPLTLIVPRAARATDDLTGGQDRVGLRVPSHPVALALLRAFHAAGGHGIAAPSANRFGRISPTTAQHVRDDLGDAVALVLDGGPCGVGIESTIVAFDGDRSVLLRPGGIAVADLARVLGRAPAMPDAQAPRASGTLASHYAPRTPARLVDAAALARSTPSHTAVLAHTVARPAAFAGAWIEAPAAAADYARDLYANLRALDAAGAREIVIEALPDASEWLAIRDRVQRAVHAEDDDRD